MEALAITLRGINVSFRRILDYNYQRTYPLPPPTTIFGLLGAAIGLSDRVLWSEQSIIEKVKISVLINNEPGIAKDMWSIQKIKQGKIETGSPYFRELLFYPEYVVIFGGDENTLTTIEKAFKNPKYALSLGREDEITRIKKLEFFRLEDGYPEFSGTILPFDIREYGFSPIIGYGIFIKPPIIEHLPLKFKINKKGVREPVNKKVFTFVPHSLRIRLIAPPHNRIYSYKGRNFMWLN